ncbi:MAG: HAD family hydrolase, partial [Betaproteobacteria bacterium]
LMRAAGLNAKISSIHVNGWFGDYDKLGMTKRLFADFFKLDSVILQQEFVFAGDSPNDAPMFSFFENSVGVANVARFAGQMDAVPKYVTRGAAGKGFAELAAHLLGDG